MIYDNDTMMLCSCMYMMTNEMTHSTPLSESCQCIGMHHEYASTRSFS